MGKLDLFTAGIAASLAGRCGSCGSGSESNAPKVGTAVVGQAKLTGSPTSSSLPSGGIVGQVLTKKSNSDYDVEWTSTDRGWNTVETTLFTETVTTVDVGEVIYGALTYVCTDDPPETLTITFDGTDYECQKTDLGYGEIGQGGPDFTNYPFFLVVSPTDGELYTETAGTHTISAKTSSVVCSNEFTNAVKTVAGGPLIVNLDEETETLDKTWAEINAAAPMVFVLYANGFYMNLIGCGINDEKYLCFFAEYIGGPPQPRIFLTDSENGYPVFTQDYDDEEMPDE